MCSLYDIATTIMLHLSACETPIPPDNTAVRPTRQTSTVSPLEKEKNTSKPKIAAKYNSLDFSKTVPWQEFSEQAIDDLVGTEHLIFIAITADWSAAAKRNENTVLRTEAFRSLLAKNKIWPMKADYTQYNKTIDTWLKHFHNSTVPLYLLIPAKRTKGFSTYANQVIIFRDVVTVEHLNKTIEQLNK